LLSWHGADPISEYERHRNAAIREAQGNRNPFIDFPELTAGLDLSSDFGTPVDLSRTP
jgi:endonuclease I